VIYNNVIVNMPYGVLSDVAGAPVVSNNGYSECTSNTNGIADAAPVLLTAADYQAVYPYAPVPGSLMLGAGLYLGAATDFYREVRGNPPTLGAIEGATP
jgi:hypothetical protein